LVTGPGQAGVGRGIAFKTGAKRQAGTVLVVWEAASSSRFAPNIPIRVMSEGSLGTI